MKAALFYEDVLRHARDDAGIHVQCAHKFKDPGELYRAEQHYNEASVLIPNDPDLSLQFGHFYMVTSRLAEAELSYRRTAELMSGVAEPIDELAGLVRNRRSNSGDNGVHRFTAPTRKASRDAHAKGVRSSGATAGIHYLLQPPDRKTANLCELS
jgi:hypothetical protein